MGPDPEPEAIKGKCLVNEYRTVTMTHGLLDEWQDLECSMGNRFL